MGFAFEFTPEVIAVLGGAIISIAFSYIPGTESKWEQLAPQYKRLIMAGIMLVVTAVAFGLLCWGVIESPVACDRAGLFQVIYVYVMAIIANQSVYAITKRGASKILRATLLDTSREG
jgi:hypothetical protein